MNDSVKRFLIGCGFAATGYVAGSIIIATRRHFKARARAAEDARLASLRADTQTTEDSAE